MDFLFWLFIIYIFRNICLNYFVVNSFYKNSKIAIFNFFNFLIFKIILNI